LNDKIAENIEENQKSKNKEVSGESESGENSES